MRHPFDGLELPEETPAARHQIDGGMCANAAPPSRRSFFRTVLAGGAGLLAAVFGGRAMAQGTRYYDSPSGSGWSYGPSGGWHGERGRVTTYALGEEMGGPPGGGWRDYPRHRDPYRYTTYALGEESGSRHRPRYHHHPPYGSGWATTMALGEEGGRYTTQALREEGGGW